MLVPRFYVPGMTAAGTVTLPDGESHHLRHVLRAAVGDEIRVFDGRGREWAARVADTRRSAVIATITHEVTPVAEPPARVTIAAGLLKAGPMDELVRDATMMGAAAIVPIRTAHVAVGKRAAPKAVDHWHRVAVASAKQCGRALVPDVHEAVPFEQCVTKLGGQAAIMLVEPAASARAVRRLAEAVPRTPVPLTVLTGPEGGWSEAEVAMAVQHHVALASLGPRTLRAEAAPAAALSALWTLWGW